MSERDRDQLLSQATDQYWQHIIPIVWLALLIHVGLIFLFLLMSIPTLAIFNIFSVMVYIHCLNEIEHYRYLYVGTLMSVEILAHAVATTALLGWESNFYLFVFSLIPIVSFSFQQVPVRRALFLAAIAVLGTVGYALRHHTGTASGLSPSVLNGIGIANAVMAIGLLTYTTLRSVEFTHTMKFDLFNTASRDSLTNLYTRRHFMHQVSLLDKQVGSHNVTLLLLDIDHFKAINDSCGHSYGDMILQRIARAITDNVRESDIVARWGGEEFLVMMPDTSLADARRVAERLLTRIQEWVGQTDKNPREVTATLAISAFGKDEEFEKALNRADKMLYAGKQQGRNRLVIAD
ncbi:GGDEF domain-containing protein [Cronobacter sakazakii]|uniref:diguanylate cyclase n=1 Tax=Cronobacter sakazakii TaxID=28141 RepID=A0A7V7RC22_CROSK|nr:GGDEF domain-containing protein [Cronobacter sakazakii]CCK11436.1 GGDEF domain protein [Cronobacter sakazakii 680]AKE94350.1 GGDEF domain protein [Cronobacter sakazakii]AXW98940.2 GGDEF domain-containing protein [Cronobacter sakazakii]EGT4267230.1 GGDEF domain-containing protein [Cronobacter sakazakii]EGT4285073.1 GGDEF domain-containing protein [Cronobacter sakazakii]